MAIELQGRKLVPIGELDVPTFSVTGEKDLPAVKNVPIISSVASSKGNDGPLSIMMINRDLDRSVSCRITIEGWSGRLNLTVQKLTFESLLSTNLADMDVSIKTADRTVGGPNITISIGPASVLLLTVERGGS
jgi:alpha-L-arabinofuranosidase